MAHDFLEMWQGSQNLHATQNESHAQTKQMTAVGYISDTEEIIKASWSNCQHDGAAAFKLLVGSPLPPALSAKNLPGGRTQVFNIRGIQTIDRHRAGHDEDSAPERSSDTENWLNWKADLENPNGSKDNWEPDDETDIERGKGIDHPESPAPRDVSAAPNVPCLIWSMRKSTIQSEQGLIMVTAMETRGSKGNKKQ